MVGTFVWAPLVIWGLDQATAAPRGLVATGTRAALGLIGGILAGLASGYVLDGAWMSRWRIVCALLAALQYARVTRISSSGGFDAVSTFLPGLIAGVAAFVAFPVGRRWSNGTTNARVA